MGILSGHVAHHWSSDTYQMASPESLEVWATLRTKIQAEKGPPHPKIEKNKCVLNWLLGKIQCFKPMFFFFLSGKSPVADPAPPLVENSTNFFFEPFP